MQQILPIITVKVLENELHYKWIIQRNPNNQQLNSTNINTQPVSRVSITGNLLVNPKNSFKLNKVTYKLHSHALQITLKTTNNSNNPKAAE